MKKEKFYKIKNQINWRKEEGCFMLLDPKTKILMFYNSKISRYISNEGFIENNGHTVKLIKYLLTAGAIEANNEIGLKLNYSLKKISAPLNVTIQITNRCNLNCIHCHRILKNTKDLDFASFKKLIRELRIMNVFNINISGGEPALIKNLPEMIKTVDDAGMKVTISTNGLLLNRKSANLYRRAGLKNLQLSLDSFEPLGHDFVRGVKGSFVTLMENIKILKPLGMHFTIVTTLINQTPEEYSKIIDLAYALGASAHKTNTVIPQGEGKKLKTNISPIKKYKSVWVKKREEYKNKMSILAETMFAIQLGKKFIDPSGAPSILRMGCPAGTLTANINEYGDINPCPFFSDIIFGNIYKNSFKEIWSGGGVVDIFRNRDKIKVCGKCEHKKVCGGCRARSYGLSKNLLSTDPLCFKHINL